MLDTITLRFVGSDFGFDLIAVGVISGSQRLGQVRFAAQAVPVVGELGHAGVAW